MRSRSESSLLTEASSFLKVVRATSDSTSAGSNVIAVTVAQFDPPQRDDWRDIGDFVERWERDPRKAAALARARQELAHELMPQAGSLAELRLRKGLSQAQLAARLDMAQPNISRLEAGATDPLLSTITRLATALDTPVESVIAALNRTRELLHG